MKVSIRQLEAVLSKMRYQLLGYKDTTDLAVEISLTQEDPGSGVMVDCLTIKGIKPIADGEESTGETRMEVEVYPDSEKLEPRASKIETYKINDKNRY